mgnify:FL=1
MQFKGFKPEAMKKIQGSLGFQGYAEDFDKYLEDNPDKKAAMDTYEKKAIEMMNGGVVLGYANGGSTTAKITDNQGAAARTDATGATFSTTTDADGQDTTTASQTIGQEMVNQAYNPMLPQGGQVDAYGTVAGTDTIVGDRDALDEINVTADQRTKANVAKDIGPKGPRLTKMEYINQLMKDTGMTISQARVAADKGKDSWANYIAQYEATPDPTTTCLLYTSPSPRD